MLYVEKLICFINLASLRMPALLKLMFLAARTLTLLVHLITFAAGSSYHHIN